MIETTALAPREDVDNMIMSLRGYKVILDFSLAEIYGISVKRLVEQVKRNIDRFPPDFMFQLTTNEMRNSNFAIREWGGRRRLPYAFTEHGAVMAANILRSKRAIHASIYVVRVFVKLRQFVVSHRELTQKLDELERNVAVHDKAICSLFDAIRKLMALPEKKKRRIGFDLNKKT
jgi:hypothetical protein